MFLFTETAIEHPLMDYGLFDVSSDEYIPDIQELENFDRTSNDYVEPTPVKRRKKEICHSPDIFGDLQPETYENLVSRPSETVVGTESPTSIKLSEELTEFTFSKKIQEKENEIHTCGRKQKQQLRDKKGKVMFLKQARSYQQSLYVKALCAMMCAHTSVLLNSVSATGPLYCHIFIV